MVIHSRQLVSVGNVRDTDLYPSRRECTPAATLQCWQHCRTGAAGELEVGAALPQSDGQEAKPSAHTSCLGMLPWSGMQWDQWAVA